MKRSWIVLALAVCLVSALALMLAACGGGGGSIVGTWSDGSGMDFTFTSDGAFVIDFDGQKAEATYSAKDGKLSISGVPGGNFPESMDYEVAGDKLTLTSPEGEKQTLQRK